MDMRDKAVRILVKNRVFFGDNIELRERVIDSMIDFVNQETKPLKDQLERKLNESHVSILLAQIEDKNKTNL